MSNTIDLHVRRFPLALWKRVRMDAVEQGVDRRRVLIGIVEDHYTRKDQK